MSCTNHSVTLLTVQNRSTFSFYNIRGLLTKNYTTYVSSSSVTYHLFLFNGCIHSSYFLEQCFPTLTITFFTFWDIATVDAASLR